MSESSSESVSSEDEDGPCWCATSQPPREFADDGKGYLASDRQEVVSAGRAAAHNMKPAHPTSFDGRAERSRRGPRPARKGG